MRSLLTVLDLKRLRRIAAYGLTTAALSAMAGAPQVSAATIASWSFSGLTGYGPQNYAPGITAANTTVGGLTRGPGVDLGGTPASNAWGGRAWDFNADSGDYVTFTAKANTGFELSLTQIDSYNVRRSGTGPTSGQWQYSLNGTTFDNIGGIINWGSTTNATGNVQPAIDLSGIANLQNVPDTTTVTFRLLNFGGAGTGTWYLNSAGSAPTTLSIQGSVAQAIPEPSTLAISGLGVASVFFASRRRFR